MRDFDLAFSFGIENTATQILYFAADQWQAIYRNADDLNTKNINNIRKLSEFRNKFRSYLESTFDHSDFLKLDTTKRADMMQQIAGQLVAFERKAPVSSFTIPQFTAPFSTGEMTFDSNYFDRINRADLLIKMREIASSFGLLDPSDKKGVDKEKTALVSNSSSDSEYRLTRKIPTLFDIGIMTSGIERTATKILYSTAFLFPPAQQGRPTHVDEIEATRSRLVELLQVHIDYDKYKLLPEGQRDTIRQAIADELYLLKSRPYYKNQTLFLYEKDKSHKSFLGTQEYIYTAYAVQKDEGKSVRFDPLLIENFKAELKVKIKEIANKHAVSKAGDNSDVANDSLLGLALNNFIETLLVVQGIAKNVTANQNYILKFDVDHRISMVSTLISGMSDGLEKILAYLRDNKSSINIDGDNIAKRPPIVLNPQPEEIYQGLLGKEMKDIINIFENTFTQANADNFAQHLDIEDLNRKTKSLFLGLVKIVEKIQQKHLTRSSSAISSSSTPKI